MKAMINLAEGRSTRLFGARFSVAELAITVVLVILALAVIFPLVLPFFFALKSRLEYSYNPWALPKKVRWDNFTNAWKTSDIGKG